MHTIITILHIKTNKLCSKEMGCEIAWLRNMAQSVAVLANYDVQNNGLYTDFSVLSSLVDKTNLVVRHKVVQQHHPEKTDYSAYRI